MEEPDKERGPPPAVASPSASGHARPQLVIPSPENLLLVMHNFDARSPDELTLSKGEKVELLEKDDEFGDGWYLGRSLATNRRGLFPQVYTTPMVINNMPAPIDDTTSSPAPSSTTEPSSASTEKAPQIAPQSASHGSPQRPLSQSSAGSHISESGSIDAPTPPLSVEKAAVGSPGRSTPTPRAVQRENSVVLSGSSVEERVASYAQSMRSPVVEDTLSDIEEAITEISKSCDTRGGKSNKEYSRRHSAISANIRLPLPPAIQEDSSSEYSRHEHDSGSGSEIEEDEDGSLLFIEGPHMDNLPLTQAEVKTWTPAQVSRYLQSRQIPLATCEKLEDEEVSGSILLQLEMSHLKDLEIGSFGKRFEVLKEIEHLVKITKEQSRARARSGSDSRNSGVSFSSHANPRQRSGTNGSAVLPLQSYHNRPASRQHRINVQEANMHNPGDGPLHTPHTATTIASSVASPLGSMFEAPRSPPLSPHRDSASECHHHRASSSRRYSSLDYTPSSSTALNSAMCNGAAILAAGGADAHRRDPSFDKNWSMGAPAAIPRPSTASGVRDNGHKLTNSTGTGDTGFTGDSGFSESQPQTPKITEQSYFSSGESAAKEKERKVLHKKSSGGHNKRSSYIEEQRVRSGTTHSRHSRIGSTETARKISVPISAASVYHTRGSSKDKQKRRSASLNTTTTDGFPYDASSTASSVPRRVAEASGLGRSVSSGPPRFPPISVPCSTPEAITDKDILTSPLSIDGNSLQSIEGSTTTSSITATVEPDSPYANPEKLPKADRSVSSSSQRIRSVSSGARLRQKSEKHKTSAWKQGLREITPAEAAEGADYSGWMKKRGSTGIGVWKSRFFVLQGRRLSYFYSENDKKEKGLIDITSHRVLPATEEWLVSLHYSFAAVSPIPGPAQTSPAHCPTTPNLPTRKSNDSVGTPPNSAGGAEKSKDKKGKPKEDGWFTFKLVPPAPGASKGVTFTPPKLHYFATDTREEGKSWMTAIMKATIDRDESKAVVSSYGAKTISLTQAKLQSEAALLKLKMQNQGSSVQDRDMSGLAISGIDMGIVEGEEADIEDGREGSLGGPSTRTDSGIGKPPSIPDSTIDDEPQSESVEAGKFLKNGNVFAAEDRHEGKTSRSTGTSISTMGIVA